MKTHTYGMVHKCDFPGCDYRSIFRSSVVVHAKTHTIEGQMRQRKQEKRLLQKTRDWGFTVDVEVTINARRGDGVRDAENRYFSKLDFVILNCVHHIVIVECDEDQHRSYLLPCELSRMTDTQASLVLAGYTLPVHWVRYSPVNTS